MPIHLFGWFAIYRECHHLLGQRGSEGRLICQQSDGDELYEVFNAEKRVNETN